jgi:hypothetical protein
MLFYYILLYLLLFTKCLFIHFWTPLNLLVFLDKKSITFLGLSLQKEHFFVFTTFVRRPVYESARLCMRFGHHCAQFSK